MLFYILLFGIAAVVAYLLSKKSGPKSEKTISEQQKVK